MSLTLTNEDNMELMARYSDNYFDLAFIDPPYGIGASNPTNKPDIVTQRNGTKLRVSHPDYVKKDWDNKPASKEFGNQVFRVSKNQMIFGANYFDWIVSEPFKAPRRDCFDQFLKDNPNGWIVWDKMNGTSDQFDCELLYTSFEFDSFVLKYLWSGMMQGSRKDGTKQEGNKKLNEKRIHPTQKPIQLYGLILNEMIKMGHVSLFHKILETHLGSCSIAIACHNLGFDLTGCELDKDYYDSGMQRIKIHTAQQRLF